jgi:hypothetical protein
MPRARLPRIFHLAARQAFLVSCVARLIAASIERQEPSLVVGPFVFSVNTAPPSATGVHRPLVLDTTQAFLAAHARFR